MGVGEPIFLGGAGRWRDSGMTGAPPRHSQRFIDADDGEAVGALVAIIRDLRPHVVVTYDPKGGYGHPDHIHAHEVTTAAVAAAGGADYPGEPWAVPKFYWTVMALSAMTEGIGQMASELDLPLDWAYWRREEFDFGYPDADIDAVVDAPDSRAAKVAALRAYATQVTVDPGGLACALSNNIALPIGAQRALRPGGGRAGRA